MANGMNDCCGVMCGVVCAVLVAAAFPVTQITLGAVYLHECPASPAVPLYVLVSGVLALVLMSQAVMPKILPPQLMGKIWVLWALCLALFALSWFLYGSYHIYAIYQPSYTKPPVDPSGSNASASRPPAATADPRAQPSDESPPLFNQTLGAEHNLTGAVPLGNSSEAKRQVAGAPPGGAVAAPAPYCHKTLYLFAFWTTTLVYGFAALGLVVGACFYGCLTLVAILSQSVST